MSWCPKCKNEYRAGISICPDCNEELMEELTEAIELDFVPLFQTVDEETKDKIVKYLIHCGHKVKEETGMAETEEGTVPAFQLFVPKADLQEAVKEIRTVLSYDAKQEEEQPRPRRREPQVSNLYVDAKERCREYKSTGIMFLVFAVLFLVFGLLNASKIITFMAATSSLVVIFGLAAVFCLVGITSLAKVSSLRVEASQEEQTTDQILSFLKEHFPKKALEDMKSDGTTGELLYFQFTENMKEALTEAFPEADENYIDALLEDYYNTLDQE